MLDNSNVRWVLAGACFLGLSTGLIGCFAFLQKKSLVGDTLAHAALPGVAAAFLITQNKSPFILALGATISCGLGFAACEYLSRRTKIKEDSALAIVLSLFFAAGVFLLSIIQRQPSGTQAGLDKLLFGQAAALVPSDLTLLAIVSLLTILFVVCFFRPLRALVFDPVYASTTLTQSHRLRWMLAFMLVLIVVTGLQLVGVVLVAALLLTPAAAARYWSDRLQNILILAALFGTISGIVGTQISLIAPRMPTGPWMVVTITLIFALSLACAPHRGLLARAYRRRRYSRRIHEENILRSLYKFSEKEVGAATLIEPRNILAFHSLSRASLERHIARLVHRGELRFQGTKLGFTPRGHKRAEALTRRHRLWEAYLNKSLQLPPDHVHADAEEIEHILSPDLEEALHRELDGATEDPHGRSIPLPPKNPQEET